MSKPIFLTDEQRAQIAQEIINFVSSAKIADGKITFTKDLADNKQKATLRFTEMAYIKMMALVMKYDKEIAWYGVAERGGENEYLITDILVYPQEVTSATVEMDMENYGHWLYHGLSSGDERYDNIWAQGHSHVNMSTGPSGTDLNHQREILADLRNDTFYIFMIWNKKNEHTIRIFDLQNNVMFENTDVTVEVIHDVGGVLDLLDEAKANVKDKVYYKSPAVTASGSAATKAGNAPSVKTEVATTKPATTPEKVEVPIKTKNKAVAALDDRFYDTNYWYDDDPYGPFGYSEHWNGRSWK